MFPPVLAPFPDLKLSDPASGFHVRQEQQAQQTQKFGDRLEVTYDSVEILESGSVYVFSGKVTAKLGQTLLTGDRLRIDTTKKIATAEGSARLTDPIGEVSASEILINWGEETGSAKNARIRVGNARITAAEANLNTDFWVLKDASITLSRANRPPYRLTARSVRLVPGATGVARHVHLEVFGTKLGPWPSFSFSLSERAKSFSLPSITNKRDAGVGVQWDGNIFLNDKTTVYLDIGAFPKTLPTFAASYSFSPLDPLKASGNIRIPTELGETAESSFLANIRVPSPKDEFENVGTRRVNFSLSTEWNRSTIARLPDTTGVSKLLDFAYENSGLSRGVAYGYTGRLQRIRGGTTADWVDRFALNATLLPPPISLGKNLSFGARLDGFGTLSDKGTFGFLRAQAGLSLQLLPGMTVSGGYVGGYEAGNRDFAFDGLPFLSTAVWRFDYSSGPYTFRYMQKYDLRGKAWYDREYEVAFVAEAWEPFIAYRQFPSSYQVGVRLRLDNLADQLTKRRGR